VDWQFQRSAAERAVRHLVGARGVTNEILVRPAEAGSQAESGKDITTRIRAALRRSAAVAARQIDVETVDGNVTLTGDVHTHAEREEAERIAWSAQGVGAVDNCLTVTPWGHGPSEEWGY
jgi:osmotically-inducible protein OsmY